MFRRQFKVYIHYFYLRLLLGEFILERIQFLSRLTVINGLSIHIISYVCMMPQSKFSYLFIFLHFTEGKLRKSINRRDILTLDVLLFYDLFLHLVIVKVFILLFSLYVIYAILNIHLVIVLLFLCLLFKSYLSNILIGRRFRMPTDLSLHYFRSFMPIW